MASITEDQIEQEAVQLLQELGYHTLNAFTAQSEDLNDQTQRKSKQDVVFHDVLKARTQALNPHLPESAIQAAISELTQKRPLLSPLRANQDIYAYLHDGLWWSIKKRDALKRVGSNSLILKCLTITIFRW